MMARRGWIRPPKPDYRRPDRAAGAPDADRSFCRIEDWAFLWPLVIIGLTGFLPEAVRLLWLSGAPQVADCRWWSPVGALVASGLQLSGLAPEGAGTLRVGLWWFHAALSLGFVALLPFTKAKHIFTATTSLALRDPTAAQTLGGAQIAGPDCFVAQGDGLNQVTTGTLRACRTCMACPAGLRKAALGGPSAVMRRRLAANPQVGAEALIALLYDPAAPVRAEAARHAPLAALAGEGGDPARTVRRTKARRCDLPPALIAALARDEDARVRRGGARNAACPAALPARLARDPHPWLRAGVSFRPDIGPDIFALFAGEQDIDMLSGPGRNGATPRAWRERIAASDNAGLRRSVILDPCPPGDILRRLAEDPYPFNRLRLAGNPSLPAGILAGFLTDPEPRVRFRAAARLAGECTETRKEPAQRHGGGPPARPHRNPPESMGIAR